MNRRKQNSGTYCAVALAAVALVVVAGMMAVQVVRAADVPFADPFDSRGTGALHGQDGWQAERQNDAQVQTATVYAGGKATTISTNTIVSQSFTEPTATNVWVDFYAQVPHPTNDTAPSLTGSYAAAFYVASDGSIRAISNDTWVVLGPTLSSNTWYRFTVNLDYVTSRWALYMAGSAPNTLATPVATNLQFSSASTNTYFHRFRVKN